jgi:CelD/BcsL family acetyltransferase involved in cellulose biosynthesis
VSALTTEVVESAGELAALEAEWWDLWQRCPIATPFQSPAWLIPWWQHFHPGELFTVAVRESGRLMGLACSYIEHGALGRRILPLGISVSDYLDILLDPQVEAVAGEALVARIAGEASRWDSWELEELAPGATALRLPLWRGAEDQVSGQSACPVLPIPAEDPLGAVPAGNRRKLRHAHNRAGRRACEIVTVQGEEWRAFLPELFRLHAARWQSRGEQGVLAGEAVQSFHHGATGRLAAAGLLRLYGLRIDGVLAGAYYGFGHGDRAYYYLGGFDPAFSFESPGMMLVGHAIQEAGRKGAREFHFLRGQEAYKYEWGAADRWNSRRSIRRRIAAARHG